MFYSYLFSFFSFFVLGGAPPHRCAVKLYNSNYQVAVIVPVYRELHNGNLRRLIQAFQNQTVRDQFRIFFLVNNSPEVASYTKNPVFQENQETIRYLLSQKQTIPMSVFDLSTKGISRNIGNIRNLNVLGATQFYERQGVSTRDVILAHLDADSVIDEHYIEEILSFYSEKPETHMMTGYYRFIAPPDAQLSVYLSHFAMRVQAELVELYYLMSASPPLTGCSRLTCRLDAFLALDGFPCVDYAEDQGLVDRFTHHGLVIRENPELVIPTQDRARPDGYDASRRLRNPFYRVAEMPPSLFLAHEMTLVAWGVNRALTLDPNLVSLKPMFLKSLRESRLRWSQILRASRLSLKKKLRNRSDKKWKRKLPVSFKNFLSSTTFNEEMERLLKLYATDQVEQMLMTIYADWFSDFNNNPLIQRLAEIEAVRDFLASLGTVRFEFARSVIRNADFLGLRSYEILQMIEQGKSWFPKTRAFVSRLLNLNPLGGTWLGRPSLYPTLRNYLTHTFSYFGYAYFIQKVSLSEKWALWFLEEWLAETSDPVQRESVYALRLLETLLNLYRFNPKHQVFVEIENLIEKRGIDSYQKFELLKIMRADTLFPYQLARKLHPESALETDPFNWTRLLHP